MDLRSDNVTIVLKHFNGSNSTINYFSNGSKKYSKERVEVYNQEELGLMTITELLGHMM